MNNEKYRFVFSSMAITRKVYLVFLIFHFSFFIYFLGAKLQQFSRTPRYNTKKINVRFLKTLLCACNLLIHSKKFSGIFFEHPNLTYNR